MPTLAEQFSTFTDAENPQNGEEQQIIAKIEDVLLMLHDCIGRSAGAPSIYRMLGQLAHVLSNTYASPRELFLAASRLRHQPPSRNVNETLGVAFEFCEGYWQPPRTV